MGGAASMAGVTGAVLVVGAGTMGAGIAQVAAQAGHPTLLLDTVPGAAQRAIEQVRTRLARLAETGRLTEAAARRAGDALRPIGSLSELGAPGGLGTPDEPDGPGRLSLVIEAIIEDLAAKRTLLAELEQVVPPDCLLATNTSSLSVTALAAGLTHPGRVIGLHFFNPAPVMPLVEVVAGAASDADALDRASATMAAWGKTPVRAASTPGFIVNRVARPFYGEAHRLLEERAADAGTIDAVLREAGGFRMGPLELTDLVGQDVNLAVSRSVWEQTFHDPRYAPSTLQQELVAAGRLGRKSGRGIYRYEADAADAAAAPRPDPDRTPSTTSARPAPAAVLDIGGFVVLAGLVERMRSAGVGVRSVPRGEEPSYRGRHAGASDTDPAKLPEALPGGGLLLPSGGRLVETEGETATARSIGAPHILIDWALDITETTRVAVAACAGCPRQVLDEAIGLLQAAGLAVSVIEDVPGLVVARTVAMLVNEATDLVARGTARASDVDTAMRLGTSYPLGPLAWGERLSATRVTAVLDALHAGTPTGRYRVTARLRRAAQVEEAARLAAYLNEGSSTWG